ncbi:MAG TPA: DUF1905 domain-containing protein, partial [Terriglobales bacterium]
MYAPEIPERISSAIRRRGPVPVLAKLNRSVEIQASLVPMGGGRSHPQLNTRTRSELGVKPGDPVCVSLWLPEKPPNLPLPSDPGEALREADLQGSFASLPVEKQNHIILGLEESARERTREKRLATGIEIAFRARELAYDRGKFNQ